MCVSRAAKIDRKYACELDVGVTLQLIKFTRKQDSLGLSLSGNKDRNKMSVFIVASRSELNSHQLRIGDEILEVSGMGAQVNV